MPVKEPKPADLEPIERASRDELESLQLARLKGSLSHAYRNVPHYRKAFDAAGVTPDDLRTLADLAKFPTTSGNQNAAAIANAQAPVRTRVPGNAINTGTIAITAHCLVASARPKSTAASSQRLRSAATIA